MGEVYRAFDRLLSRSLAYKVLSNRLAQDPVARDLLLQEARSAAGLNHPNIITVYDLGIENGRAFICMELVEGESYAKILKRDKRLSLAEIMHLVVSACQGLDHAHHRGIVHRDLKPSNILLTKEHRVKILDFGLAQPIRPDDGDASGSSSGTPKYIAPEQARGEATDAPHRSLLVRGDALRADRGTRTVHRRQLIAAPYPHTATTIEVGRARRSRRSSMSW